MMPHLTRTLIPSAGQSGFVAKFDSSDPIRGGSLGDKGPLEMGAQKNQGRPFRRADCDWVGPVRGWREQWRIGGQGGDAHFGRLEVNFSKLLGWMRNPGHWVGVLRGFRSASVVLWLSKIMARVN